MGMAEALSACCSDTLCSGVAYTNVNSGTVWVYETRVGNSIANSSKNEVSYFRY